MKMFASDVRPAATPSIGTGKASARSAAPSSASEPTIEERLGPFETNSKTAAPKRAAPPTLTGSVASGTSSGTRRVEHSESRDVLGATCFGKPGVPPLIVGRPKIPSLLLAASATRCEQTRYFLRL